MSSQEHSVNYNALCERSDGFEFKFMVQVQRLLSRESQRAGVYIASTNREAAGVARCTSHVGGYRSVRFGGNKD